MLSTFYNLRPSKIYPNWDFWFENKTSGNPDWQWQRGAVAIAPARETEVAGSNPARMNVF
jgi:hypothetical protein